MKKTIDQESMYDILDSINAVLIRSEFVGGKPPIKNPTDSVCKVIKDFFNHKVINISYIES
jgi:hypothetical protein